MRVGMGYDVHKLVEDRKLILGGVEIPYEKGLLGHSDADVLLHAIMDALLGAAALGDIGRHFPDTDDRYKGADSMVLLKEVKKLLDENFFLYREYRCDSDRTAAEACPIYRRYEKEYCRMSGASGEQGECEGYDRGKTGIYRSWPWNQFTGCLSVRDCWKL